jgi:hypothetical protein
MGPVSASVQVDVSREWAFDFLADLANRPAFTTGLLSGFHLFRIESTGVGAGARFRFRPRPRIWADTTIVELMPPHRISERGHGGRSNRIACATEWELIEGPGPLTTIRTVYWTESAHPLDRLKAAFGGGSYERGWKAALNQLRELLESGAEAPRVGVAGGNRVPTGIP